MSRLMEVGVPIGGASALYVNVDQIEYLSQGEGVAVNSGYWGLICVGGKQFFITKEHAELILDTIGCEFG